MLLLCIESSCDETAAAIIQDGKHILSNIVASQIAVHAEYGGVVPEIASRKHLENILPVINEALLAASVTLSDIEGIAVTRGPGLVGALLVGISAAKGIAIGRNIPVAGVHHIESHLLAIHLEQDIEFPYIALVVSGGHTHLYKVTGIGEYKTLGQTIDDAAGEAFDKVAKLMGIPYPGGAVIDKLARSGNPEKINFPRPLLHDGTFNFSFSGLKTAVMTYLKQNPDIAASMTDISDLAASFQSAICQVLVEKSEAALKSTGLKQLVVAGGVACNSGIRKAMSDLEIKSGIKLFFPSPALCSDNAAMLGVPGDFYLKNNLSSLSFDALPTWSLDSISMTLNGKAS